MAYDEGLVARIRERLGVDPDVTEKRMCSAVSPFCTTATWLWA